MRPQGDGVSDSDMGHFLSLRWTPRRNEHKGRWRSDVRAELGASALSPLLLIRLSLDRRRAMVATLDRLPIDRNENDGLIPGPMSHPNPRGHRSRTRLLSLAHTARPPEFPSLRRRLAPTPLEPP